MSYKYHCRSGDSPGGGTRDGNSVADGVQWSLTSFTEVPVLSLYCLQVTVLGEESSITNWWYDLIPITFLILVAKNDCQSYVGTNTSPASFPTSRTWLTYADSLTTSAISVRLCTCVLLNRCFRRPKQESGVNFVCPTTIKESVILSLRPVRTRHIRY